VIETLSQGRDNGWKITARCAWGPREAMKSIRECKATIRLDLDTLVWTPWRGVSDLGALDQAQMPALRSAAEGALVRSAFGAECG
jgi:hypothetical protein